FIGGRTGLTIYIVVAEDRVQLRLVMALSLEEALQNEHIGTHMQQLATPLTVHAQARPASGSGGGTQALGRVARRDAQGAGTFVGVRTTSPEQPAAYYYRRPSWRPPLVV